MHSHTQWRVAAKRRQMVMPPTALQPLPDPTWSSRAKSLLNSTTSKPGGRRGSRERERGQTVVDAAEGDALEPLQNRCVDSVKSTAEGRRCHATCTGIDYQDAAVMLRRLV